MIHTKEPWEIRKGSSLTFILAKDGNGNTVAIASVFPRGVAGCETKGNANLMKAAPKMYEALEAICRTYRVELDDPPEHYKGGGFEVVLKTLAEARGEGEQ